MNLKTSWLKFTGVIPPGRFDPASGEVRHYLETRHGMLESQERHGSVLVRRTQSGEWRPIEPRDGLTLTHNNSQLGFWKDGAAILPADGRVSSTEVVSFQEAYPERKNWELDLWADHAVLAFHDGKPRSGRIETPQVGKLRKPVKHKAVQQLKSDPLAAVSRRFVGLLERRIPTSFDIPSQERREKILAALEPGDVILETNLSYPGWKQMLHHGLGSNYTHAAMYEGDGKFLEATPHGGVQRSDLEKYFNDTVKVAVVKMPYATEADREAALNNFRSIRGKPYNRTPNFLESAHPQAFGCTEAVTYCLENLPHPIRVPRAVVLTGHKAVSPAAFKEIPGAVVKYDDEADYYQDLQHSWPVGVIGLGTGLVSDALASSLLGLSPAAAAAVGVVGGALGYYLTVSYGNWRQKGKFGMFVDGK